MRTLKNRVSNVNKIRYHTASNAISNQSLQSNKSIRKFNLDQSHFLHQTTTHHTIKYSTPRIEKLQPKPHQLLAEISHLNLIEKGYFKNGVC